MSKGSAPDPVKPEPTATETAQARISAEKWNDFIERYQPIEGTLRDRINALDGDSAYARAIAQATNNASSQLGGASMAAARQLAGGGNGGAFIQAGVGAGDMAAKGIGSQYLNQRANFLNQGKSLAEMGAGISAQGMGAFKSAADYDRTAANQKYAEDFGSQMANFSSGLAVQQGLSSLAMQYAMPKIASGAGGFGSASTPWTSLSSGVSNGYSSPQLVQYADMQNFGSFGR